MSLLSRLLRRRRGEDSAGSWHLVFWNEYGWGATFSQVPLGDGLRSTFIDELKRTGGRKMLTSRGYLAGGTYDFEVRGRESLVAEGGWNL